MGIDERMEPAPRATRLSDEAAAWVVRRDRGLTESESAQLSAWLSENPSHATAFEQAMHSWALLDGLADLDPPLPAISGRRWVAPFLAVGLGVAAAAAVAIFVFFLSQPDEDLPIETLARAARAEPRTIILPDDTIVRLNSGSILEEAYDRSQRLVFLRRGEAHFKVTKDAARPFVVQAGDVSVRAVGTAFNVVIDKSSIDVLVTEGTVRVDSSLLLSKGDTGDESQIDASRPLSSSFVVAGQRATVSPAAVDGRVRGILVSESSLAEVSVALAWREGLLKLSGSTLEEIVESFEKKTGRRLRLADDSLRSLKIGGRFPSDDVEGFVELLRENYGISASIEQDRTIVLGK